MEDFFPMDGILTKASKTLLIVSLLFQAQPATASQAKQIPSVRVLVDREKTLQVDGFDLVINDSHLPNTYLREPGRASFQLACKRGGIIEIKAIGKTNTKKITLTRSIKVESMGGFIKISGRQYRDSLFIHSFNGDCLVVNHLDIEKYVAGVLHSEMNASWNMQTLKAQAVAARTYALHQIKQANRGTVPYQRVMAIASTSGITKTTREFKPPFDLDSSVKDQVYEGAHMERYKALQAVRETEGMVLVFADEPIKAFYHSTCGGYTESALSVWGKDYPYIRTVRCGYCDSSPRQSWSYQIPTGVITQRLREEKILLGELVAMNVVSKNIFGRVKEIRVQGSQGMKVVSAAKLRSIFGAVNVMSTVFEIVMNTDRIVFLGHGSGHGVGLCQWGAKTMGDRGIAYGEILKRYYPLARLKKIY